MPQIVNLSADDGTMRRNHHFRSDLRDRILSGDKFTRLITILLLSLAEVGDMRMRNVISAFGAKIQARSECHVERSRGPLPGYPEPLHLRRLRKVAALEAQAVSP